MKEKIRIGALISGGGTNLQAIIDACEVGEINGEMIFVGTDNPTAGGLERAKKHGIPNFIVDYKKIIWTFDNIGPQVFSTPGFDQEAIFRKQGFFSEEERKKDPEKVFRFLKTRARAEVRLLAEMEEYPFDLLVLAGFMRNLTPYFIDRVNTDPTRPRIMNIHPALLPAFPGTDGYGDTFRYGCKVGGCTVHFIDYGEDSGPIIDQVSFPIESGDTLDDVKKKGLKLEWLLYPECIQLFAEDRLRVVEKKFDLGKGKTVTKKVVDII